MNFYENIKLVFSDLFMTSILVFFHFYCGVHSYNVYVNFPSQNVGV